MGSRFCSPRVLLTIVALANALVGQTYRNLALNPNDVRASGYGFPHASSNSEYPCMYPQDTTNGNHCTPDTTFLALSAINGDTNNAGHGTLAYASWGPQKSVPGLWWKVDFGHNVTVDKAKIWVRADWAGSPSHDSYWKRATLVFSDGTRDTISIDSLRQGQEFPFSSRTTQSVTITDFVASDTSKWCAFTEVQAWGYDPPTSVVRALETVGGRTTSLPSRVCLLPGQPVSHIRVPGNLLRADFYSVSGAKVCEIPCNGAKNGALLALPSTLRAGVYEIRCVAAPRLLP